MYHSTYKNVNIYYADKNSSGIRYYCMVKDDKKRSGTLRGIKSLIKQAVTRI